MNIHLRRSGAVYLLAGLFVSSWLSQWVAMRSEIAESGYAAFFAATFENWQSEFLQLAVQALLVVGYAHSVFTVSVTDLARIEAKVDEMLERCG